MAGPVNSQVARAVPFDNSTNGFSSTDVQAAIEEISATTAENFSYNFIVTNKTIPTYQQMIVYQTITIDETLFIDGELVLIDG